MIVGGGPTGVELAGAWGEIANDAQHNTLIGELGFITDDADDVDLESIGAVELTGSNKRVAF